jgi:ketol-acid reductoisomerase
MAYAKGIGGTRGGILETTFREEVHKSTCEILVVSGKS